MRATHRHRFAQVVRRYYPDAETRVARSVSAMEVLAFWGMHTPRVGR